MRLPTVKHGLPLVFFVAPIVLLALPLTGAAREPLIATEAAAEARVAAIVTDAMKAQQIPGVSVAVMRGDRVLVNRGFGVANIDGPVPVTANTVFPIGSISKQFTSAAILVLAERIALKMGMV